MLTVSSVSGSSLQESGFCAISISHEPFYMINIIHKLDKADRQMLIKQKIKHQRNIIAESIK